MFRETSIILSVEAIFSLYREVRGTWHEGSIGESELHHRALGRLTLARDDIRDTREPYTLEGYTPKLLRTDGDDKNHSRVKAALRSLHQKTFTYEDNGTWECFSIIANPRIRQRSSKVSFIVDARVWDVLLDFSRGFSRYDLKIAFTLESSYSMRLYEMMAGQKEPIAYSVDSLRREFRLEDKYRLTKDFIRRVIESAKNELDVKSPVTFTYRPLKDGKKITRIMFFPVRQESKETGDAFFRETIRKYGAGAHLSSEEKRMLIDIGFSATGIKNNLELFMECKKRLDFVYELAIICGKAREKRNPCGWCIKTLKGKLSDLR